MKVAKEDVVAFIAALRALLEAEGPAGGGQMQGYEAAVERLRTGFLGILYPSIYPSIRVRADIIGHARINMYLNISHAWLKMSD